MPIVYEAAQIVVEQFRAVTHVLPRNIIVVPRAGFTTETAQRFHSPFSWYAKEQVR
jgi:hypothetical protein